VRNADAEDEIRLSGSTPLQDNKFGFQETRKNCVAELVTAVGATSTE